MPQGFINELHYDNDGTDTGERIEIAGPAGTNLGGWSLVLYNGNGGQPYATIPLAGTIPDQDEGFGTLSFTGPAAGIQNGSPDGLALVDSGGSVQQFLSYEGSFTAVGGPMGWSARIAAWSKARRHRWACRCNSPAPGATRLISTGPLPPMTASAA